MDKYLGRGQDCEDEYLVRGQDWVDKYLGRVKDWVDEYLGRGQDWVDKYLGRVQYCLDKYLGKWGTSYGWIGHYLLVLPRIVLLCYCGLLCDTIKPWHYTE